MMVDQPPINGRKVDRLICNVRALDWYVLEQLDRLHMCSSVANTCWLAFYMNSYYIL